MKIVVECWKDGKEHILEEFCNEHFYLRFLCGIEWRGTAPINLPYRQHIGTLGTEPSDPKRICHECFHGRCLPKPSDVQAQKTKRGYEFL